MGKKENNDPNVSSSKYEKRQRKQTEKGEKLAEELKKKKRNSQNKRIPTCKTCNGGIQDPSQSQRCSVCSELSHVKCIVVLNKEDNYCSRCVGQLNWEEIEELEASNFIKHLIVDVPTTAAVKWRTPRQIEKNRLAALARREQRLKEHQTLALALECSAGKGSLEKQLLMAADLLENSIDSQLNQLKKMQLSNKKTQCQTDPEQSTNKQTIRVRKASHEKSIGLDEFASNDTILVPETMLIESQLNSNDQIHKEGGSRGPVNMHPNETEDKLVLTECTDQRNNKYEGTNKSGNADETEQKQDIITPCEHEIDFKKTESSPVNINHSQDTNSQGDGNQQGMKLCIEELFGNISDMERRGHKVSKKSAPRKEIERPSNEGIDQISEIEDSDHSEVISESGNEEDSTEFYSDEESDASGGENMNEKIGDSKNTEALLPSTVKIPQCRSNQTLLGRGISSDNPTIMENPESSPSILNQVVTSPLPAPEIQTANIAIKAKSNSTDAGMFNIINTVSPANIPERNEEEFFTQESDGSGFICKLCQYKSTAKGGIKNHITRTHKIQKTLLHPPKSYCRKCKKEVKVKSEAGQCTVCNGLEHYRCTKSGKQHRMEFQDGLPFTCVRCCIPGINTFPELSVRKSIKTELMERGKDFSSMGDKENNTMDIDLNEERSVRSKESKDVETARKPVTKEISETSASTKTDVSNKIIAAECGQKSNHGTKQLKQDNVVLTKKIKELVEEEKQTKMTMTLLSVDNSTLSSRIKELEEMNLFLTKEKTELQKEKESLHSNLNALRINNDKAQEVALEVQKVLTEAVRDANFHTFNKDRELEKLVKENERLKVENATYKELLSPEIVQQRAYRCQEIASKASDINNNDARNSQLNNEKSAPSKHDQDMQLSPLNSVTIECSNNNQCDEEAHERLEESTSDFLSNPGDSDEAEEEVPNRGRNARYCHFYNRRGCTAINCKFIHDEAPLCELFLKGQCHRRLCQYRHQENGNFQKTSTWKPPDMHKRNWKGSWEDWIQIGEKQPSPSTQFPYSDRKHPHHRYRYQTSPHQQQIQYHQRNPSTTYQNNNTVISHQSYPPLGNY